MTNRGMMERRAWRSAVLLFAAVTLTGAGRVAAQADSGRVVTTAEIAPGFHLLSNGAGHLVVFAGQDASIVAGSLAPDLVTAARALLPGLAAPPVKYAIAMEGDSAAVYGDGGWGESGTIAMAQEDLYDRMAARRSTPAEADEQLNDLPTMGFSRVVQLYLPDEEIHLVHDHDASTNADIIVHFEKAGLLMMGGVFTSDGYPRINLDAGGKVDAMIRWVDWFCEVFVRGPSRVEPIVPGRGPVATLQDLIAYRDMLVTVRDRVHAQLEAGQAVAQVIASSPTAEFDARWGQGPVSPDAFVAAVYESLAAARQ
jgi:hypothetical protein